MSVIDISGLLVRRPGYTLQVDRLRLLEGARVGLVGPSGAGKSTLLDLLALIRKPDGLARFRLMDHDITASVLAGKGRQTTRFRRLHLSYILQDGGMLPYLTVGANARLAARLAGVRGTDSITAFAEVLGIADLLGEKPARLSGGQRQRAAVLRGLASGAGVILADEPTAALDRDNAAIAMKLLAAMPSDRTVFVSSHHEELLLSCGFQLLRLVVEPSADGVHVTLREEEA